MQWTRSVTGVLDRKSRKCSEKCFQRCSGKSGCSAGSSRGCSGELGVLQGVLPRVLLRVLFLLTPHIEHSRFGALPGAPPIPQSTLWSTLQRTPISQSSVGSTSQSTSRDFLSSTPVTGRHHCKAGLQSGNPPKNGTFTAWNRTHNCTRTPPENLLCV